MADTPQFADADQPVTPDARLRVTPVGSSTPTPTFDPNEPVVPIQPQTMGPKFDDSEPVIPLGSDEPADHGLRQRQALSPVGKALSPITGYWPNVKHFENEGLNQASEGLHQMFNPDTSQGPLQSHTIQDIATGAGKVAAGTAGYVFSPVSAAYRSFIGQPVEDVTGIPREYTEFAAQLATPYIGLTGPKLPSAPVTPPRPALPVNRFGVTESVGQASQDLPTIQAEQGAYRGQAGEPAQKHATEFFDTQQPEQLAQANRNVSKSFDVPGSTSIDPITGLPQGQEIATKPTEAANLVQQGLQQENLRQKASVKALYDKAKALPGEIDADVFRDMPVTIREGLSQRPEPVYVDENTPNAAKMLRYLNDRIGELKIRNDAALSSPVPSAIKGVTLEGVEQWRKAMSGFRADALKAYGTNPSDARAAQAVMNEFDRLIGESVNSGAFTGDPQAVQAFNDARAAHSARMKLWGNDAIGRRLQAIIGDPRFEKDPATLNDVTRWLYGESGSSNSLNVGTVKRIRKILGDQSPEWSAIKQGLFRQLIDKAGTARGDKAISNRLREFLVGKGSDLAGEVYSPAERQVLSAYADMYDRLDVPLAGANWPNTAAGVIPHIKHVGTKISGAIGALIGHSIWPGVGGEVGGYVAGQQVGKALTKAEENRNYKQVANLLPIISQRFKIWQQAAKAQQRVHTAQTQARLTAAAVNLTNAVSKLHGLDPNFAKMLTQGPSGPGTSNAQEQQRARGGKVAAEKALPADHQLGMRVPKGGSSCHTCFFFKAPTECRNKGFAAWNHGSHEIPGPPDEYCCDNYQHTFKRAKGGKVKLPSVDDESLVPDDNVDTFADQMIQEAKHFADGGVPTVDDSTPTFADADQPVAPGERLRVTPGDNSAPGTQTTVDQPSSDNWQDREAQANLAAIQAAQPASAQTPTDTSNLPDVGEMRAGILKDLAETPFSKGTPQGNALFGTGEGERFQMWPERMIRSGATLPHDVMTGEVPAYETDPETGEMHTSNEMVQRAQDMAGMAGSGGLANAEEGAVLNSTPSLRPALKYNGKIYKAPPGGEHMDAIPPALVPEFQRQALSGEDISNFNFGFLNHKGQFLNREQALEYGINEGLLDPHTTRYGVLTTPILRSETSEPGAAIAGLAKSKEPFYSAAEQTVAASKNQKMQGVQWANWLKNQPGVKPDELQYTGVDNWLRSQQGPVTKQQVQDYLAQNKVQLNDVTKGGKPEENYKSWNELNRGEREHVLDYLQEMARNIPDEDNPYLLHDLDRQGISHPLVREQYENTPDIFEFQKEGANSNPTKYSNWQLPGGENYREHLITLPSGLVNVDAIRAKINDINKAIGRKSRSELGDEEYERLIDQRNKLDDDLSEAIRKNRSVNDYHSSHWDEPNILAHVRTNERDVGGVPSLHLEEIQSDMHQQGRKQGYRGEAKGEIVYDPAGDAKYPYKVVVNGKEYNRTTNHDTATGELEEGIEKANKKGVPDAPFKTSWPELAMKRMIRQAAEEGKSRISWTPGEAQAARYDLSKELDTIRAYQNHDGSFDIVGQKKGSPTNGGFVHLAREISAEQMPDYVGKDIADKLVNGKQFKPDNYTKYTEVTGAGLKVGGEGMKGFYDQMLPKMVEKLGKQYGVKVKQAPAGQIKDMGNFSNGEHRGWEVVTPDFSQQVARRDVAEAILNKEGQKVWYFDIPEKMKQDVLTKGQALFSDTSEPGAALAGLEQSKIVNLGARREQKEIGKFHKNLMSEVADRARERAKIAQEYHENGKLPFEVGTRFSTEHSRQNNLHPLEVTGHYVDAKNPEKYGYYYKRGPKDEEESGIALVNDPNRPAVAEMSKQFVPFTGVKKPGAAKPTVEENRAQSIMKSAASRLGQRTPEFVAKQNDAFNELSNFVDSMNKKYETINDWSPFEKRKYQQLKDKLNKLRPGDEKRFASGGHVSSDKENVKWPVKKEPTARAHGGRVVASLINRDPTEPQKHVGNYKKEHIHILGLPITIENARGHSRSGVGKDGKRWTSKLHAHYGYIIGHQKGHDGDHVDVYVGPHIKSKKVFVINQVDSDTKKFDEHKCCLGFATLDQALNVYNKGFSDGKGPQRIGSVVESTIDDFRDWLRDGDTHKPYRYQFNYGKIKHKGITVDQQI